MSSEFSILLVMKRRENKKAVIYLYHNRYFLSSRSGSKKTITKNDKEKVITKKIKKRGKIGDCKKVTKKTIEKITKMRLTERS